MEDNGNNPSEVKDSKDVPSDLSSLLWLLDDDFVPDMTGITDEMVDAFVQELLKIIDGDDTGNKDAFVVPGRSNGSCGSMVSDAASSVMAGIAVTGPIKKGGPGSSSSSSVGLVKNTKVIAGLDVVGSPAVAGTGLWLVEGSASTYESCIQSGGAGSYDQVAKSEINNCDEMEVDNE